MRTALVARLRNRFSEVESAALAAVRSVFEHGENPDPDFLRGQRAALAEAIEHGLAGIELGEDWSRPSLPRVTAQARRAARNGVKLDTVLRRYAAGDRLMGEFILNEASHFPAYALRQILSELGPRVDSLMAAVSAEYMRELERSRRSPAVRVAERVEQLLAEDDAVEADGLDYVFDAWHVGVIVKGVKCDAAVRAMASGLDRTVLSVPRDEGVVWAWMGGYRPLAVADIERFLSSDVLEDVSLAVGEPRRGIDGWRLTHHEAQAAYRVMLHRPQRLTCSSNVVLLAAVLSDQALSESLRETYLRPLDDQDSRMTLCRTLGTYLATEFNAASTSAILGIDRSTVQRHLRRIEERLGRNLHTCHAELKVALEFRELVEQPGASI